MSHDGVSEPGRQGPAAPVVLALGRAPTAAAVARALRPHWSHVVVAPTLRTVPGDLARLAAALEAAADGAYVGMCLTSAAAVDAVARVMATTGVSRQALAGLTVGSVGPGTTRALAQRLGMVPDVVPARATGAALGGAFPAGRGRLLLPLSDRASPVLGDVLATRGYECDVIVAYRIHTTAGLPRAAEDALRDGRVGWVAVTSPSCAQVWSHLGGFADDVPVVSIGPVTSWACRGLGLTVAAEASTHDVDGLVRALRAQVTGSAGGLGDRT